MFTLSELVYSDLIETPKRKKEFVKAHLYVSDLNNIPMECFVAGDLYSAYKTYKVRAFYNPDDSVIQTEHYIIVNNRSEYDAESFRKEYTFNHNGFESKESMYNALLEILLDSYKEYIAWENRRI